jgi:hypothetical protein
MDLWRGIAPNLPTRIEEIAKAEHLGIEVLWGWARDYSRLRHRSQRRKRQGDVQKFEAFKTRCILLAVAREPDLFLVFPDPGRGDLWIIYQVKSRTLLHLPRTVKLLDAIASPAA